MENQSSYLSKVRDFVLIDRAFTNDKGEVIQYQQPAILVDVNGEEYQIDFKLERADKKILNIADEQK